MKRIIRIPCAASFIFVFEINIVAAEIPTITLVNTAKTEDSIFNGLF